MAISRITLTGRELTSGEDVDLVGKTGRRGPITCASSHSEGLSGYAEAER